MKRIILLWICALISAVTFAQTQHNVRSVVEQKTTLASPQVKGQMQWHTLNAFTKQAVLNKTTAVKARLDSITGPEERDIFLYNTQNQLIEATWYGMDSIVWLPKWRDTYTYQNNLLYEDISAEWYNSVWVNSWKDVFYYDASNRLDYILAYNWDSGLNQWEAQEKTEYSYNSQNLIEEVVDFNWQNGAWEKSYKTAFEYTATNKIELEERLYWNGNDWEESFKMEYQYNASDLLIEMKAYSYQPWNMQWVNSVKSTYHYNAGNQLYQEILYSWNSTMSAFEPIEKLEYNYNATNDATTMIRSSYNGTVWEWSDMELCTFDPQFAYNDLILPLVMDEPEMQRYFSHKLDTLEFFEFQSSWVSTGSLSLFYTLVTVFGTEEATLAAPTVYPNPTTDWLIVEPAQSSEAYTFELYDFEGRLLLKTTVNDRARLNISRFASGIYFWRLHQQNGQGAQNGKLIKN